MRTNKEITKALASMSRVLTRNKRHVLEHVLSQESVIQKLREEIRQLRDELEAARELNRRLMAQQRLGMMEALRPEDVLRKRA